ncbi:MAG: hypothetical protein DMG76_00380, partial [Acidobacteria bacterium]
TVRQNAALPAFNSANNWVTHNATLNDTQIFGPGLVNTANFTFARNTFIRSPLVTSPAKNWAELGCKSCISLSPPGVPTDWAIRTKPLARRTPAACVVADVSRSQR